MGPSEQIGGGRNFVLITGGGKMHSRTIICEVFYIVDIHCCIAATFSWQKSSDFRRKQMLGRPTHIHFASSALQCSRGIIRRLFSGNEDAIFPRCFCDDLLIWELSPIFELTDIAELPP